jgi:hypothetical protein
MTSFVIRKGKRVLFSNLDKRHFDSFVDRLRYPAGLIFEAVR